MLFPGGSRRHDSQEAAINSIRRAAAAAAAGILLALSSVVVATPAHADNEVAKLVCSVLRTGYDNAQLVGCLDLE
ncbi:hypothetical protein GO001_19340 [Streptomyces sp. NRRL B-1677]|uniref:hypothetical protein n=1 Tax=Streptomyces TaxID=1883 RepID=UPI0018929A6F|nr:hypothetical protein [Streptomyces sp. NRRL B-1677]MBF6047363.1 hypothetical protein [Streptomyces sp. NRRL B-1677]